MKVCILVWYLSVQIPYTVRCVSHTGIILTGVFSMPVSNSWVAFTAKKALGIKWYEDISIVYTHILSSINTMLNKLLRCGYQLTVLNLAIHWDLCSLQKKYFIPQSIVWTVWAEINYLLKNKHFSHGLTQLLWASSTFWYIVRDTLELPGNELRMGHGSFAQPLWTWIQWVLGYGLVAMTL